MILARGDTPPSNCRTFFNGHFSEVLQKKCSEDKSPFLANFCFLIVPPHKFFSGGNPGGPTLVRTELRGPDTWTGYSKNLCMTISDM